MNLTAIQTLCILIISLLFSYFLKSKIQFLKKYYIPAPLVGGLIISLIFLLINKFTTVKATYNFVPLFVAGFFASIGLRFNLQTIKRAFKSQMLYLLITIVIAFGQNSIALIFGKIFGKSTYESLILGSSSLMGDHTLLKTIPEFGKNIKPYIKEFNGISILTLYIGTIFGVLLFSKLKKEVDLSTTIKVPQPNFNPISFLKYLGIFSICITFAMIPSSLKLGKWINPAGGGFLCGIILRQFFDVTKLFEVKLPEVNLIGNFCLSMLLISNFAMFDIKLIKNISMYSYLVLSIQLIILIIFTYLVVFKLYKKNGLASYVSAGLIGFSYGMPASTMSSIQCFTEEECALPLALFIVPPVGAWLITIVNPYIIGIFM
ncbi:sodium/glutamate symporter [Hathewaya histolytica]|uniref:Sodium--glutamate symport carrier (GltS) n=1 Tax=Hathewaya histolytica TaxID=1498 RepID=A0A4U9R408_HATHI|nr:sodium/glutamate symporter [Hathewaya histolytica]VTQ86092.1 sodium--glutamate symport carrier (gltS) [Hathewaya histolytica]